MAESKNLNSKILQVIDTLEIGGAEYVFVDLIERFEGAFDYDILIIRDKIGLDLRNKLEEFEILNRQSKFSIKSALELHRVAKKYDILHVHLRHTFRYVAWVRLIFRGKYKLVLHDHTGNIDLTFNEPPFFEYKLIKPDYYIGVSKKLVEWSIEKWRIEKDKVNLLINLPFLKFERSFSSNNSVIPPKKQRFIQVANIKPIKNQKFTLELLNAMDDLKVDFYGNIQDEVYFQQLKKLHFKNDNCILIQNSVLDNSIIGSYQFGIFTSKSESGPMVLIEYLLSGVPFIAYKTGEISDCICEFFPEFFMDNWDLIKWIERYREISSYNLHTEVNVQKINQLMIKHFNSKEYQDKLLGIYNLLS